MVFNLLKLLLLASMPLLASKLLGSALHENNIANQAVNWNLEYKEGGGGFWLKSPGERFKFGILGYAQSVQKVYASKQYKIQADEPLAFYMRRARIDFWASIDNTYDLFIELDGAPTTSVKTDVVDANSSAPVFKEASSTSGFSLVEAHISAKLAGDNLKLRTGKFVVPFSTEGSRSSRSIDTVERYMALNALYSLPALDTQYGLMFYGSLMEGKFQYYLASFNGNAKASANTNENNGTKEFVAKVVYAPVKTFNFGLGFDTSSELNQTLAVNDLVGGNFATVAVSGRRQGFSPDVYFVSGDFSTRFELMQMRWDDKDVTLQGGYWQGAYFISGNEQAGLQALLRLETVKLDVSDASNNADQLNAATTGLQWFINANLRNQFNLIASQANEDGGMGVYAEKGTRYAALNELQLKF